MQVNVVTVRSGWILQKIAERIVAAGNKGGIGEFNLSHSPRIGVDVNFYCDVQNCYHGKTGSLDIGLFTHVHADDLSTVRPVAYTLDFIFHMASRYMDLFNERGVYPYAKMSRMIPYEAPEGWKCRQPRIGIFQRGKYEGKGFHFMMDFAENDVCKLFEWAFLGNDWEPVIQKMKDNGVTADQVPDQYANYPEDYEFWYKQCDRVLIPSKWEGGPISCLEAMTLGVPVIAADVGWCKEMGAEIFDSPLHLAAILSRIGDAERRRASFISHPSRHSYERCARQIVEVAETL